MKQIITILIIAFLWGCENKPKTIDKTDKETLINNSDSKSNEIEMDYKEVNRNYIDTLIFQTCLIKNIEFIDFYPILDSIAEDNFENLILVDLLKTKGFLVTDWGRGNWIEGPRIVSYKMSNEQCECQIDKLYYSAEDKNKFKVTERIKCEQIK